MAEQVVATAERMGEGEALSRWLYVSIGTVPADRLDATVDDIVKVSRVWNVDHRLTGALISTPSYFAQCLEGPPDKVALTQARIASDPRHRDLVTISEGPVDARAFHEWSLAYAGGNRAFDDMAAMLRDMRPDNARILMLEMLRRFTTG